MKIIAKNGERSSRESEAIQNAKRVNLHARFMTTSSLQCAFAKKINQKRTCVKAYECRRKSTPAAIDFSENKSQQSFNHQFM
jgi:hypothetical protein